MDITRSLFRLIFGRRLPVTDGTLEMPGIHQRILIRRISTVSLTLRRTTTKMPGMASVFARDKTGPFKLRCCCG